MPMRGWCSKHGKFVETDDCCDNFEPRYPSTCRYCSFYNDDDGTCEIVCGGVNENDTCEDYTPYLEACGWCRHFEGKSQGDTHEGHFEVKNMVIALPKEEFDELKRFMINNLRQVVLTKLSVLESTIELFIKGKDANLIVFFTAKEG